MHAHFDDKLLRLDDIGLKIDKSRIRGHLLLDDPCVSRCRSTVSI